MGVFDLKKRIACVLGTLLAFSACTKAPTGGATAPGERVNAFTKPHLLTMADAGDINTLNPHLGQVVDVGYISQMTMAWLIKFDQQNRPYPELATEVPTQSNGGVSKDGLTITYHLRKGVKWSDGAPFDADDVVFSTNVVNNPANNEVGRQGWDQIVKIDEPDKYTVVYHLKKPYAGFVESFFATAGANPCILPKHLLAKYPNINNVPYNEKPIGIGPFKVDRWDRQQQVVLVANPLYFRGRPKLDKFIFKIVPDRDTLLAQVQAHEIDMWAQAPGHYIDQLKAVQAYTILRQPSFIWDHLDFNLTHPAVHDPIVRQALRFATDRATLLRKVSHGVGILSETPTPPTAPYYHAEPLVPFDLAKANAMLDQDGWKRGPDGIREKGGVRLVLDWATTAGSQDADEQIELIRADWKQVGVDINLRHYPPALMFAPNSQGGVVYGNKWDVISFGWSNDAIGDYSTPYGCQSFPPNGQNGARWCNPKAQAAMDALYTHYDQEQRNRDVAQIVDQMYKDVPFIILKTREELYAYNKDLKNFHPNNVSPFDNMMDVDI